MQFPLDSLHPQARPAAEAALCAGRQSAQAFWDYHELLFETVSEWSGQEDTTAIFVGYARDMELDVDAFETCVESRDTADDVQSQVEQGQENGVGGVPAFFINDWFLSGAQPFAAFEDTIEKALRGEHPAPTPTPLPEGKTPFDVNPERPGYTFGGDAYHGSPDAPIALVAFTDFSSADNREFALETWPEIEEDYIEPGDVRVVIKHFPSPAELPAFQAAVAAECAAQQDAFWEMYQLLFEKQEEWTAADDLVVTFADYASEIGLDATAFAQCVEDGETETKVNQDLAIAMQNQFPPAPQFFAFMGERGGYLQAETLKEGLDQLLSQ